MTDHPEPGPLAGLFEDLEQQATGIRLAERDAELADRARGEYAAVTLTGRIHASVGLDVAVTLAGGQVLEGILTEAGADWCAVQAPGPHPVWLVRVPAVAAVRGASPRSVPEAARPVVARLGFGATLRRLASEAAEVGVRLRSGAMLHGRLARVGADFLELETGGAGESSGPGLVAFTAVEAVRIG